MNTNTFDENDRNQLDPITPEQKKRGRPQKTLNWRKIERYWEEQKLKKNLEDIFFQPTDQDMLI